MATAEFKFCPSCQHRNQADAIICAYCGKSFKPESGKHSTTLTVEGAKPFYEDLKEKIKELNWEVPAEGIAIYLFGQKHPIDIRLEDEFVIGRLTEATKEKVVDLTPYDAYALGVSRRHLRIRHTSNGYDVMDLNSTNGTWVNGQRLEPQYPFAIKSGSQIHLGNLRIFIFHP